MRLKRGGRAGEKLRCHALVKKRKNNTLKKLSKAETSFSRRGEEPASVMRDEGPEKVRLETASTATSFCCVFGVGAFRNRQGSSEVLREKSFRAAAAECPPTLRRSPGAGPLSPVFLARRPPDTRRAR